MRSEKNTKLELPSFSMPKKTVRQAESMPIKVEDRGAFRASSTLLNKQRIGEALNSNKLKSSFIEGYVDEMQRVDNAFVQIRKGDSCTDIDGIISVLARSDGRNKEMMSRLSKAEEELILHRKKVTKARQELGDALRVTNSDLVLLEDDDAVLKQTRINSNLVV